MLLNYQFGNVAIQSVSVETNIGVNDLLVYGTSTRDFGINFEKPFKAKKQGNFLEFDLSSQQTRAFGIYVGPKSDSLFIKNITLNFSDSSEILSFKDFKSRGLNIDENDGNYEKYFSSNPNGYFLLKKNRISKIEFLKVEILILALGILCTLLIFIVFQNLSFERFKTLKFKSTWVYVFLISIFLPQPLFNIAFISSMVFIIKDFNLKSFLVNKAGLIFVGYFVWFLINNLLFSSPFNMPALETMLPVLCLPFYIASVPKNDYLKVFPITAFLLGLYFLSTSALDVYLFFNLNYFSFDAFTKYLHPVYFSYLLFFSIIYLELNPPSYHKNGVLILLLIALLLCGSKLIIGLTFLFYVYKIFGKKKYVGLSAITLLMVSVFLFAPTRKRFMNISNLNNLSILSDRPIKSVHDPRINGLTLRLIIWQETIESLDKIDLLFGKGVGEEASVLLQKKFTERGLEIAHTKYDPHNQYITTLYKLGLIGASFIIFACIYLFCLGFKSKNKLLLFSIVLFTCAMFSESILQRIVGINFFISILLLLSNRLSNESKN
jgi:O-antigen ligase